MPSTTTLTYADILVKIRDIKGWTNDEMAENTHVNGSTISRWLSNQNVPSTKKLRQLATVLGIDIELINQKNIAGIVAELSTNPVKKNSLCIDLSGNWTGWSVYIPIEGFFSQNKEAIYKIDALIAQQDNKIKIEERLIEAYTINNTKITQYPGRTFLIEGVINERNIIGTFLTTENVFCFGTLHLFYTIYHRLTGFISTTHPITNKPAIIKIMLEKTPKEIGSGDDELQAIKDLSISLGTLNNSF